MAERSAAGAGPTYEEIHHMHEVYREGGLERKMSAHVVYPQQACPHSGCSGPMQAIDFRLNETQRLRRRAQDAEAGTIGSICMM